MIDRVFIIKILFMMINMSFWCINIVNIFSVLFSVSELMLFINICVGYVLNYKKFKFVLIMVVYIIISLLVSGIWGIFRYLVKFVLFVI